MKSLRDSTVAIVGLGLMGGSLALALRQANACARIVGIERDAATRAQAKARGAVDDASASLEAVHHADVIVLATPVRTIVELLVPIGKLARAGALILDLGSTKQDIVRAMEELPPHLQPIGAHPMCGKETWGLNAADANLFQNAVFALTPLARTAAQTLAFAQSLAHTVGARPVVLDAARHDRIVAATSHLPFAVAVALQNTAREFAQAEDLLFTFAARGFRDASRLAASDTTMMLDILMTNSQNVAPAMRRCARHLVALAEMLERRDENALRATLQSAAAVQRGL